MARIKKHKTAQKEFQNSRKAKESAKKIAKKSLLKISQMNPVQNI
jgi:hypothetical protein